MHVHSASCNHPMTMARFDPTRTGALRTRYEADLVRRFKALKTACNAAILDDDALALDGISSLPMTNAKWTGRTPRKKVESFQVWLREQQDKGILEIGKGRAVKAGHKSWQDVYLQSAYQKGLGAAYGQVAKAGIDVSREFIDAAFFRPIHADRIGLIYTRAYTDLKGITSAIDGRLSSVLAEGMLKGHAPKRVAKDIAANIDSIGIVRARKLARTEIIRSHSEATLNAYEEAEMEGVNILSEFSTSADGSVCPKCEKLEGETFTVQEARGIIPVHPNCRCTWIPVVSDRKGKRKLG